MPNRAVKGLPVWVVIAGYLQRPALYLDVDYRHTEIQYNFISTELVKWFSDKSHLKSPA